MNPQQDDCGADGEHDPRREAIQSLIDFAMQMLDGGQNPDQPIAEKDITDGLAENTPPDMPVDTKPEGDNPDAGGDFQSIVKNFLSKGAKIPVKGQSMTMTAATLPKRKARRA